MFIKQNKNSAFWYISLPSLHDYVIKFPNFTFYNYGARKLGTKN